MSASVSFGFGSSSANKDSLPSNSGGSGNSGGTGPTGNANLGTADWIRRANGSHNGTSSTGSGAGGSNASGTSSHRRPSLSTTLTHNHSHNNPSSAVLTSSSNTHTQPASQNQNYRYSKEQLLDVYKRQESEKGALERNIEKLLGEWASSGNEPGGGAASWGRSGDESLASGAEVCWDKNGGLRPMSLQEMDEAEKELFSGNVNSPQKVALNQNAQSGNNPQGNRGGNSGTKNTNRRDGDSSTTPNRPQNRRREPSDVGPGSPLRSDGPGLPGSLSRRGTGLRTSLSESFDNNNLESRLQNFSRWGSKEPTEQQEESKEKEVKDVGNRTGGLFRRPSAAWGSGTGSSSTAANTGAMGSFAAGTPAIGGGVFGGGMGGFTLLTDKKKSTTSQKSKTEEPEEDNSAGRFDQQDNDKDRSTTADDSRPMTSDTDPFARGSSVADSPPNYSGSQKHISRTESPASGLDSMGLRNKASFSNLARDNASASKLREEIGFSGLNTKVGGFGLGSLNTQFGQMGLGPALQQQHNPESQALSPTETNPYQSPLAEKIDEDDLDSGLGSIGAGMRRGMTDSAGGSRSGKSSIAGNIGGLGSIGSGIGTQSLSSVTGSSVWGTPGSGLITPLGGISTGPTSASIGGGGFFGLPDLSNPAAALGGTNSPANVGGFGSVGRASRLGSLFNTGIDQQGQHHLPEDDIHNLLDRQDSFDSLRLGSMSAGLGSTVGRRNFASMTSGIDSPLRERSDFDLFGLGTGRSLVSGAPSENPLFANVQLQSGIAEQRSDPMLHQTMLHQAASHPNLQRSSLPTGHVTTPAAAQTPGAASALPQLVMPDKIQWEYRDPSGTVQGPFTGLEMHEWYKAGFFTPDLHVKRIEESDFEPLGSFVRRIGNQREPFLVPMQSLTNQPAMTPAASAWGSSVTGAATPGWLDQQVQTPGAQPPFAGSFPSFGTTLTAEQQNALERRKQEEQYLMARQREYLMQQQVIAKQMQAHQQSLHHQTSHHSLQSQSSLTSLTGANPPFPPTPVAGAHIPNVFDQEALLRQAIGGIGEGFTQNELQQLGQFPLGQQSQIQPFTQPSATPSFPGQPATTTVESQAPTAQPRQEEEPAEQADQQFGGQQANPSLDNDDTAAFGTEPGLKQEEFAPDQAQASAKTEDQPPQVSASSVASSIPATAASTAASATVASSAPSIINAPTAPSAIRNEIQSRKVTSPKPPPLAQQQQSAWNDTSSGLPAPFPPPPSAKAEPPRTPNVETPSASIAPWAKELENNVPKGPSLKEIQELEAKQAALEEAAAAELRRGLAAQQATQPAAPAPAPGLPSTATWASANASPAVNSPSAWAKPLAKPTPTGPKKTLSQIQKEEEARKAKAAQAAAQAAAATNNAAVLAGGKRYADLASKPATSTGTNNIGGAWLTVGPGGKSKNAPSVPSTAALTRPPLAPTASLGLVKAKAPVAKPAPAVNTANDEFMKWCRASLKGLNPQVNLEDFLQSLLSFPADAELIADSVYASSTIIDGRRFADEFIRRRKAAAGGVVMDAGNGLPSIGAATEKVGGWNEVAKKNSAHAPAAVPKDVPETNVAFKVVPGKRKGRRA